MFPFIHSLLVSFNSFFSPPSLQVLILAFNVTHGNVNVINVSTNS